jgi:hypothetical protein
MLMLVSGRRNRGPVTILAGRVAPEHRGTSELVEDCSIRRLGPVLAHAQERSTEFAKLNLRVK